MSVSIPDVVKHPAEVISWEPARASGQIQLPDGSLYDFRVSQCNTSEFKIGDRCLAEFSTNPFALSKLRFRWDWKKHYHLLDAGIAEFHEAGLLLDWSKEKFLENATACEHEGLLDRPIEPRNPECKRTFIEDRAEQSIFFDIPQSELVPFPIWQELAFRYYVLGNGQPASKESAIVLTDAQQSSEGNSSVEFWNSAFAEFNKLAQIPGPVVAKRKGKSVTVSCNDPKAEVKVSLGWGVVFACDCASTYNELLKRIGRSMKAYISVRKADQMLVVFRESLPATPLTRHLFNIGPKIFGA